MDKANKTLSIITIILIALVVYWGFVDQKPSADAWSGGAPEEFSVENVRKHLQIISKDVHHVGTPGHKEVQNYLVAELEKLGLETEIQTQTVFNERWGAGTTVENIITRINGSGSGKALMLLSHYDSSVPFSKGAGDDGSGIATILEGVRAFLAKGETSKNDIIILFSDAEELGLLGAKAFIQSHKWNQHVGLILNFEARGSGGPSFMLMETNGKNSKMLQEFLNANPGYPTTNSLSYSVYKMLPNDTDLTPFREEADINGFNFAYIDDHFDYHTAQDAFERVDVSTLAHQADYFVSTMNYFANSDLSDLNSDSDRIFVNFPFIKMLHYPFSWNSTLFIIALAAFIVLVVLGIKKEKLSLKKAGIGFLPFIISLIGGALLTYGLWKLIMIIHPTYSNMLHGFTYNGYIYITAFTCLNLWLLFVVYNKYFASFKLQDLLIAPIFFWLLVNAAVLIYLPGAAFFIIPVFMALIILALWFFSSLSMQRQLVLFVALSIPVLYMLSPLVKLFPVALGLGMLFICAIFIVLMFGLLIPVFTQISIARELKLGFGALALLFFIIATAKSGFNIDRKKPTNITFYYNANADVSYWASRNAKVDEYLQQFLGDNPEKGSLPADGGTRSSVIKLHKKTENRSIPVSEIDLQLDTIAGDFRTLEFAVIPKRKVHRYEFFTSDEQAFESLNINGANAIEGAFTRQNGRLITRYTMGNQDSLMQISMTMQKDMIPNFRIFETSYDLETNPEFDVTPKPDYMMPFAFVTGDAVVTIQTPDFSLPEE